MLFFADSAYRAPQARWTPAAGCARMLRRRTSCARSDKSAKHAGPSVSRCARVNCDQDERGTQSLAFFILFAWRDQSTRARRQSFLGAPSRITGVQLGGSLAGKLCSSSRSTSSLSASASRGRRVVTPCFRFRRSSAVCFTAVHSSRCGLSEGSAASRVGYVSGKRSPARVDALNGRGFSRLPRATLMLGDHEFPGQSLRFG
jgi:hypothetical protein